MQIHVDDLEFDRGKSSVGAVQQCHLRLQLAIRQIALGALVDDVERTGTTVWPRKLTRCVRSAVNTRLAWIFSLGVGGGVPQRSSFAAGAASCANRGSILAVAPAKQARADDRGTDADSRTLPRFHCCLATWPTNQLPVFRAAEITHPVQGLEAFSA